MNNRLSFRERLYGTRPVDAGAASPIPPLVHSAEQDDAPLAFAQRRIWFFDQLYPGDPIYHFAEAFRVRGPLDVAALRDALDVLLAWQPALRTRFTAVGGVPAQRIGPVVPFPMSFIDAAGIDDALEACTTAARRPFDLANADCLARGVLARLAPDDHVLALVFHHIAWDGTSMGIVAAALNASYQPGRADPDRALPTPALTFADFARWQRVVLTDEAMAIQKAFWRSQLAGLPRLALPTDRPYPGERSRNGARVWREHVLDRESVGRLRAVAHGEGATLFSALLTVYAMLLHRASGQDEFALGFPVAGRVDPQLDDIVGCFINMLSLRADFRGNPTFTEALGRVRDRLREAYDHQDVPFEVVVADVQRRPNLARGPIFDVVLNVRSIHVPKLRFDGTETTRLAFDFGIANYDQTFEISETADGLDVRMQYNSDVFDAPTIVRFIERFGALARAAACAPEATSAELDPQ